MNTILEKIKQELTSKGDYKALIRNLASPIYIADKDVFKTNLKELLAAFKKEYNNVNVGYSFKTNYCETFIGVVKRLDCFAEVASPMEFNMALESGFSPSKIIYNGVIPHPSKMWLMKKGGLYIIENIDDLHEVIKGISDGSVENNGICLRLCVDLKNGVESRFGFLVGSEEYNHMSMLVKEKQLKVKAIHCHISYGRSIEQWKMRALQMVEQAKIFNAEIIDLGGNMFGRVDAKISEQIKREIGEIPSYADYAKVVGNVFKKAFPQENKLLLLECGTPIVGNAMWLLAKVIGLKTINGKPLAVLNCTNFDIGFVCRNKDAAIYPIGEGGSYYNGMPIYGCTCMEKDVINRAYYGKLAKGALVLIANVGAYGMNVSNEFMTHKPCCLTI